MAVGESELTNQTQSSRGWDPHDDRGFSPCQRFIIIIVIMIIMIIIIIIIIMSFT
jgi:lipopolysaccharide/colanic/teichoic acid biosynthesis glycosyltransferase